MTGADDWVYKSIICLEKDNKRATGVCVEEPAIQSGSNQASMIVSEGGVGGGGSLLPGTPLSQPSHK